MKIFLEMSSQELLQGISSGALVDLIKEISIVDDTEEKVITMNAAADQIQQEHMEKGEPKVSAKKQAATETPPEKNKTGITIEKLQEEAVQLLDGGTGTDRLSALLTKYRVKALPDLKPDCFAAFLADLQKLKEATE